MFAEPEEDEQWLWDGILTSGGFSVLAGKPKAGKSTLARNLALAIGLGQPFLGHATVQGPVIYLGLEERSKKVKQHLKALGADGSEIIHVHEGMAPKDSLQALQNDILDTRPALVIVDSLQKMVRVADISDYATVSLGLELLAEVARQTGCHIMAVHHLGKGEREGGDAILGSTAIFGTADTALLLRRREGHGIIESIQRYGTDLPKTVLPFDPAVGRFTLGGTVEAVQQATTEAKVLEALKTGAMTQGQIRETVAGDGGLVNQALRALFARHQVKREGSGKKGDPFHYSLLLSAGSPNGKVEASQPNALLLDSPRSQ